MLLKENNWPPFNLKIFLKISKFFPAPLLRTSNAITILSVFFRISAVAEDSLESLPYPSNDLFVTPNVFLARKVKENYVGV
jgi:hypothetical protein